MFKKNLNLNTLKIVRPGSPEYEAARKVVNQRYDLNPAAILFCFNAGDVQQALKIAQQDKKKIRIRAGRHSYEGFSAGGEDTYIIDVSGIDQVNVDATKNTATIGAGAQLYYDVYLNLWEAGRVTIPGGSCPTVGVGGLTAGGGFSFSGRKYGLTCDSVVGLELVTAGGDVLQVNETSHPELFWACRGAGNGNFGVITSYQMKLYPADDVSIYTIAWNLGSTEKPAAISLIQGVSQAWANLVENTPKELMPFLKFTLSNGEVILSSFGQFYGSETELRSIVQKYFGTFKSGKVNFQTLSNIDAIRFWGGVKTEELVLNEPHFMNHEYPEMMVHTNEYSYKNPQVQKSDEPKIKFVFHDGGYFKASSIMLQRFFNEDELAGIYNLLQQNKSLNIFVVLDAQKNGVSSTLPADYNAYAHRDAFSSVQIYSSWKDPKNEGVSTQLVENLRQNLAKAGQGAYINYPDLNLPNWQVQYYGQHYTRLQSIKQQYDPQDVFGYSQGIKV